MFTIIAFFAEIKADCVCFLVTPPKVEPDVKSRDFGLTFYIPRVNGHQKINATGLYVADCTNRLPGLEVDELEAVSLNTRG